MSTTNWDMRKRWKRPKPTPRWRARRRSDSLASGAVQPTLDTVLDVGRLMAQCEHCRRHGGQAPGPDDLRYCDFGRQELARAFQAMRTAMLMGTYVAPASRTVPIKKKDGKYRQLQLDNIVHRVLASHVESVLTPVVSPHLGEITHSACGRGVHALLVALYRAVATGKYTILLNLDVKAAFPSLPINVAMAAFAKYVEDRDLLKLIELLLRGAEGKTRHIGIPQGMGISPIALDTSMSLFFDRLWSSGGDSLVVTRYVDNIPILATSKDEGRRAVDRCRVLLGRIGLLLKDLPEEQHLCDLRAGETSELLGFQLSLSRGKLNLDLAPTALETLRCSLTKAQRAPNPPLAARHTVTGWISAMSPAFDNARLPLLTGQVLDALHRHGFREISPELVREAWTSGAGRWQHFLTHSPCPGRRGAPSPE